MICSFKKLSGRNLALLSIIKLFHVDKNIQIKQNPCKIYEIFYHRYLVDISIETLEINKQKIYGHFAIINYLSEVQRNAEQMEQLWWFAFNFQDKMTITLNDGRIQKKSVVKNDNLKLVNRLLESKDYIEGSNISECDVLTYLKIKKSVQDVKGYTKLVSWIKNTGSLLDPIVESLNREYQLQDKQQEEFKKEQKQQDKKMKQQDKPVQEQQKKQEKPKQEIKQIQQPNQSKKEKQQDDVTPEYLETFSKQKLIRLNNGKQIYPVDGARNVLITSALPYVNNVPHLGNIIGSVLSADVYARYSRLMGYNTIYICGTDEYGTATEVKAIQEGTTPQAICDKYNKIHQDIYKWFDIDFDYFGRTSTKIHHQITQNIFNNLHPQYTTIHTKPQTYCSHCQMYLADRYVSGVCPVCQFEDARGDQCDSCQKLLDPIDLKHPKCYICKKEPQIRDTTHIYIDLPKIQPALEKWITRAWTEGSWSDNSVSVSKAWLKQGLQERCITRDLKWGTPVPLDEFKNKVFYVWFDAPIGYLSITGNYLNDWESWWKNPDNVKLYQFMGKDNVPFHTVIFPSSLIGTGQQYTMLHRISTTEYLNYEGGKFSKSRGSGIFGDDLIDSGITSEVIRYYLLINRPEKSDSQFTWQDFGMKNNSELLPNIGNLINRTLKFIYKKYDQRVPSFSQEKLTQRDYDFIQFFLNKFEKEYIQAMENTEIKDGLKKAMELSSAVNKYLQDEKAWEKECWESKRSDQIMKVSVCAIRLISAVFEPFMPSMSAKINFLLGFENRKQDDDKLFQIILESQDKVSSFLNLVQSGQKLNQPIPIFRQISEEELLGWKNKYAGKPN